MQIGILTFTFSLPGCSSLKEKRQRIEVYTNVSAVTQPWQCVKVAS